MDSTHTSIIELTLSKEWFDGYEYTHTGDIVLGIPVSIFFKILNTREKQQSIHIEYTPITTEKNGKKKQASDDLSIHFKKDTTNTTNKPTKNEDPAFDKHFQCPLIDIESEMMNIPETEYSAEFTLVSSVFSVLVNQLKGFGDTLTIKCVDDEKNQIQLTAESSESGTMTVDITDENLQAFSINEGEEMTASFSLQHMHHICLFHKIATNMEIRVSTDYPLSIIYPITETDHLRLYLAPKVSTED